MHRYYAVVIIAFFAASVGIADDVEKRREPLSPPIAIDGYCMVSALEPFVWVKGDPDICTDYRGRRYLFRSEEQKAKFEASPEKFAPVLDGLDAVALIDAGVKVAGRRRWGLRHQERVFFFASEENFETFYSSPDRYVARVTFQEEIAGCVIDQEAKRGGTLSEIRTSD